MTISTCSSCGETDSFVTYIEDEAVCYSCLEKYYPAEFAEIEENEAIQASARNATLRNALRAANASLLSTPLGEAVRFEEIT